MNCPLLVLGRPPFGPPNTSEGPIINSLLSIEKITTRYPAPVVKNEHLHIPEAIPAIAKVLIGKASASSFQSMKEGMSPAERQEHVASMNAYADSVGAVMGTERASWELLELLSKGAHNVRAIYRTLASLDA